MKVTFVFDGMQVGGIERVGIDFIKLLLKKGYIVEAINLAPDKNKLSMELRAVIPLQEYKLHREIIPQKFAVLKKRGVGGVYLYILLKGVIEGVLYIKRFFSRKKFGSTDVLIAFSGHFNDLYFVANNYCAASRKIAWLHGSENDYLAKSSGYGELYSKIKNLVCLSEKGDEACEEYNTANGINKVKIYNPTIISDQLIDRSKVNLLKKQYGQYVLMVGRLDPDKDQKTLILALNSINSKRDDKLHLVLVGDGSNRERLERLVKDLKAEEFVHFEGTCYDVQNYYASAYVYAHSSPAEGLPTVLLEAMTFEVPIAATDSFPGVREILGDNVYGLISPVNDWRSLSENICRLYENKELRERLIVLGKERVKDFSADVVISKLEAFINTV